MAARVTIAAAIISGGAPRSGSGMAALAGALSAMAPSTEANAENGTRNELCLFMASF
ncbi:hypothetical protein MasN3_27640 [Massilia varians]|uniref:Uncharacterized protein n=1 Tax=Massilia varians TaxID=457921 RepID=A0ABM8C7P8_9BURK|nr:hypothetical protein MasN3_27640 [Massilia varians]